MLKKKETAFCISHFLLSQKLATCNWNYLNTTKSQIRQLYVHSKMIRYIIHTKPLILQFNHSEHKIWTQVIWDMYKIWTHVKYLHLHFLVFKTTPFPFFASCIPTVFEWTSPLNLQYDFIINTKHENAKWQSCDLGIINHVKEHQIIDDSTYILFMLLNEEHYSETNLPWDMVY